MKKMNALALAVSLICGASGALALAQSANEGWYIAPSVSRIDPDNNYIGGRGNGLGLRLGKTLSPSWDLQFGPTSAVRRADSKTYRQNTLGVDALYFLNNDNGLKPFVLVGLGAAQNKLSGSGAGGSKSNTASYANAGVGFQYKLGDQWGMQADYRHLYGFGNSPFGFKNPRTDYVGLGVTYFFDKPTPPAPKVVAPPPPPPAPAPVVEPPKPVEPPPPPPPPPPRIERYTLAANELFAFDRAVLMLPQAKLDELAAALLSNPSVSNVVVTGYTDRLGSKKYNQALSQKRADAVKAYLVSKGVSADRILANGKGVADAVVQCNNKKRADLIACLGPNRRVEVQPLTFERTVK